MAGEALPPRLELVALGATIGWWVVVFFNSGPECAQKAAWVLALYGAASALAPNYIAAVHEKKSGTPWQQIALSSQSEKPQGRSAVSLILSLHCLVLAGAFPAIADIK
ncbi:hypothetical protein T484DRAFT_1825170 [Baffinella frigidus]|nr:hypothetical protein T484DRAFT_1825170 [Cryptophyta sp. CCMP2293]